MSQATEQVEQLEETTQVAAQPIDPPITWTHSIPDGVSSFEAGPWTALVSDPLETPTAIRLAGRYVVRGLLRHTGGRSLSKDFPGNTAQEATLLAKRWVEGSIQMWLKALQSTAGSGDLHLLARLDEEQRGATLMACLNSLKVSQARGHLPPNTPVGIDALQPPARPTTRPRRHKGRKRRRK